MAVEVAKRTWLSRPRVRLSLRALMALVLVLGGGLGWFAHRARVQRDAVAAITRAGGKVYHDWEASSVRIPFWKPANLNPSGKPPWPKWLIDRLGPDFFGDIVVVFLGPRDADAVMAHVGRLGRLELLRDHPGGPMTAVGLAHVRGLRRLRYFASFGDFNGEDLASLEGQTRLEHLELYRRDFGDDDLVRLEGMTALTYLDLPAHRATTAGLHHLRGLTRLETLILRDRSRVEDLSPIRHLTGLTFLGLIDAPTDDDGLAPVAGFTGLQTLLLENSRITDAGLVHLRGLTMLTRLELQGTRITDVGAAYLAGLTRMRNLQLTGTDIGDAGLAQLRGMAALRLLSLDGTKVTDAGLVHLKGFRSLTVLGLSKTRITDAGLAHLTGLKGLKSLAVRGTGLTDSGIASIRKAIPGLRVFR